MYRIAGNRISLKDGERDVPLPVTEAAMFRQTSPFLGLSPRGPLLGLSLVLPRDAAESFSTARATGCEVVLRFSAVTGGDPLAVEGAFTVADVIYDAETGEASVDLTESLRNPPRVVPQQPGCASSGSTSGEQGNQ